MDASPDWEQNRLLKRQDPWTPGRQVASWIWAISSPFMVGFVNPGLFLHAAIKRRGRIDWLAELGYVLVWVVVIVATSDPAINALDTVSSIAVVTNWVVGSGHAFAVRRSVFEPPARTDLGADPVLAKAVNAVERRVLARQILAQDPVLASNLGIGRPDLGRGYDDGGLVDVNTAPASVLGGLPGLTPEVTQRLVTARDAAGGFSSLEEMVILADLPPTFIDTAADHLVLSPR
jgi:hypothetical protein